MEPCSFEDSNDVLGSASSMGTINCEPLSVLRATTTDQHAVVVSCWKLTAEEFELITRTKRVWLMTYGETMPPVVLSVRQPYERVES